MPALRIVVALLGAGALAGVLVAVGARLRRRLAVPVPRPLRLPVDFVAGSWAYGVLALLLGLAHLWRPASLVVAALALGAAGRFRRTGWRWRAALPAAAAGLVALPVALTPPFFYDALVYHLGLPWQGLREGGLSAHPEDLFAAFPPLAQLLSAPLLAVGLERSPAVLHWLGFVAAGAAAWGLARALGAPEWAAALGSASVPMLPCLVLVPGLPAAEAWCVAGVVAASALLAQRRLPPGAEALVGLAAGTAAAARLQGLPWGLVILGVLALRTKSARRTAVAAGWWLAGAAPWWFKNLVLLRDPLAPLGWRREGLETLWRDSGSMLHAGAGVGAVVRAAIQVLAPHASYLTLVLLAAAFAVTVRGGKRDRMVGLAVLGGLAAWASTGNLPRFLAVAVVLALALAAAAAGRSAAGAWASALALGVTAAIAAVVSVAEVVRWHAVAAAVGDPAAARARLVVNDPTPAFGAARDLPPDARTLFVGEPRGLGFPRRFVAPSQHDVSPLRPVLEAAASPQEASARLRREGFTHVLVNWGELGRLAPGYPVAPWRGASGWRRWTAFVASLGPPVVDALGVQVFVLPAQSGPGV